MTGNPPRVNYLSPVDRLLSTLYVPAVIAYAATGITICAALAARDLARKATT